VGSHLVTIPAKNTDLIYELKTMADILWDNHLPMILA